MISKKVFFMIIGIFAFVLVTHVFHYFHKHSGNDLKTVKDTHTHHIYWSGVKGSPGKLEQTLNKTYGTPKENVKHRHSGADYWQYGLPTWKHLNDQHQRLEAE